MKETYRSSFAPPLSASIEVALQAPSRQSEGGCSEIPTVKYGFRLGFDRGWSSSTTCSKGTSSLERASEVILCVRRSNCTNDGWSDISMRKLTGFRKYPRRLCTSDLFRPAGENVPTTRSVCPVY